MTEQIQKQDKNNLQRHHKIKSDFGIVDYYNYYKTNFVAKVTKQFYLNILKDVHKEWAKLIFIEAETIVLPQKLGEICLVKRKGKVMFDSKGHIKNTYPINYKATLNMWKEHPEYKEQKKIIRHENKHSGGNIYRVMYLKKTAKFINKTVYMIHINRNISRSLTKRILNNEIETLYTL